MRVLAWSASSRSAELRRCRAEGIRSSAVSSRSTGCGEVVGVRGAACEGVEGHDLDVGRVLVAGLFEHGAQPGLGAVVAVFGIHRGVEAGCEGGPVAAARTTRTSGRPPAPRRSAASRSPWARRTRPRWTRPRARRRSCRVVRPISMTRSSVVIASSIWPACSRTRPSVSRCDAFGGGVTEALRGGGGSAQVGGGVVEAFFGLGDVAEEGVEVVEDPVVAERSQEVVGVRAGGAGCDRVAEGERGVGGEDPGAAEVPRVGVRRASGRLSSRTETARSGPPFWISTSARADRLNTAR